MKPGEGGGESRGAAKKAERPFSSGLSSAELHMTHPKRLSLRAEKIRNSERFPGRAQQGRAVKECFATTRRITNLIHKLMLAAA